MSDENVGDAEESEAVVQRRAESERDHPEFDEDDSLPIEPPNGPDPEAQGETGGHDEPPPAMDDDRPLSAAEAELAFGYPPMLDEQGNPALPAAAPPAADDGLFTEEEARSIGPELEAAMKHMSPVIEEPPSKAEALPAGHVRLTDGTVADLNDPANHTPERMAAILRLLPDPTEEEQQAAERYWSEHPELSATHSEISDQWTKSLIGALQLLANEHGTNNRQDAEAARRRLAYLRADRLRQESVNSQQPGTLADAAVDHEAAQSPPGGSAGATGRFGFSASEALGGGDGARSIPIPNLGAPDRVLSHPPPQVGSLWNPIAGFMHGMGHSAVSAITSTVRGSMAAWKEADAARRVDRAARMMREMSANLGELRHATPERRRELLAMIQGKLSPMNAAAASAGDALLTIDDQQRRQQLGEKLRDSVEGLSAATGGLSALSESERKDLSDMIAALSNAIQEMIKKILTRVGLAERVGPSPKGPAQEAGPAPSAASARGSAPGMEPSLG